MFHLCSIASSLLKISDLEEYKYLAFLALLSLQNHPLLTSLTHSHNKLSTHSSFHPHLRIITMSLRRLHKRPATALAQPNENGLLTPTRTLTSERSTRRRLEDALGDDQQLRQRFSPNRSPSPEPAGSSSNANETNLLNDQEALRTLLTPDLLGALPARLRQVCDPSFLYHVHIYLIHILLSRCVLSAPTFKLRTLATQSYKTRTLSSRSRISVQCARQVELVELCLSPRTRNRCRTQAGSLLSPPLCSFQILHSSSNHLMKLMTRGTGSFSTHTSPAYQHPCGNCATKIML